MDQSQPLSHLVQQLRTTRSFSITEYKVVALSSIRRFYSLTNASLCRPANSWAYSEQEAKFYEKVNEYGTISQEEGTLHCFA
jgi:hypothetical protein